MGAQDPERLEARWTLKDSHRLYAAARALRCLLHTAAAAAAHGRKVLIYLAVKLQRRERTPPSRGDPGDEGGEGILR